MQIVAGLTLKSLEPRVWDASSPYYLPELQAVMISYADFHQMPAARRRAMERGIHVSLSIPAHIKVYLDNGAFNFSRRRIEALPHEYEEFIAQARPDWRPVPQDFIPAPHMTLQQQRQCLSRTMQINRAYEHDGFVPVIHISRVLSEYVAELKSSKRLASKPDLALGGIVPNLLRAPKALSYKEIIECVRRVRDDFAEKRIHVFGIGGTATLHLAALLRMDSVDSSGWRNRAARGIIQLPGSGERTITALGSWSGRELSNAEWRKLNECQCPACLKEGVKGLQATAVRGFRNRATHNLWTLLEEVKWIERHLNDGTYQKAYKEYLDNTTYRPLIEYAAKELCRAETKLNQGQSRR